VRGNSRAGSIKAKKFFDREVSFYRVKIDFTLMFQELIRSPAVLDDQQLKITSILAFSHVLRAACVDKKTRYAYYTDEVFDATCEFHQASRYVEWLVSMLQSDSASKRAYIAALGNTGAASALPHLQSIAEDSSISPYIRATAVISMKYQALRVPEQTSPILLSLYHDVGQPVAVRVTAVAMLFYTRPQLALLQRIAVSTWYDPNMAVAGFVRSSLISLANLDDPAFSEL
jgi:Lipoprotein amino terminal region.